MWFLSPPGPRRLRLWFEVRVTVPVRIRRLSTVVGSPTYTYTPRLQRGSRLFNNTSKKKEEKLRQRTDPRTIKDNNRLSSFANWTLWRDREIQRIYSWKIKLRDTSFCWHVSLSKLPHSLTYIYWLRESSNLNFSWGDFVSLSLSLISGSKTKIGGSDRLTERRLDVLGDQRTEVRSTPLPGTEQCRHRGPRSCNRIVLHPQVIYKQLRVGKLNLL